MEIRIDGIEAAADVAQDLEEAERVMSSLQGTLGTVYCDPGNPASIEAAIHEAAEMIDRSVASYRGNAILAEMADALKAGYADGIREHAADAVKAGDEERE
jgi:hypothetical protein